MNRSAPYPILLLLTACASAPPAPAPAAATTDPAPAEPAAPVAPAAPTDDGPMSIEAPQDVAAAPPEAEVTTSGLASRVLRAGTGTTRPTATSKVTVHYTGWTTDGNRFDSSISRGSPATFSLDAVIAGWTEGVQLMVVGERRRFWIPGAMAYDNSPRAGTPKGTLVFDIELLAIE